MAMNIKYRPLKAFLLAAQTGSFTVAASRLAVTQPSFTALIQDLESVLGLRLFERTTRKITLTAAGQEFLDRIQRPITDVEEAYRNMHDLSEVRRGAIVLGALPSTSLSLIPQALGKLRRMHAGLDVRVVEANNEVLISMLRTNQIEFAVASMFEPASDLDFEPMVVDKFCVVFEPGHPVQSLTRPTWRDLAPHDLVLLAHGTFVRAQYESALGQFDPALAGLRCEVTSMTTAANLVRQGMGVTLLPRLALAALNLGKLKSKPMDSAIRTIGVVSRKDRHLSPGSQVLVAELRQAALAVEASIPDELFSKAEKRGRPASRKQRR